MSNSPASKNDPLRGKKTGKWTKYGGAVHGLKKEKIVDEWNCQICGDTQPVELKPFLFELYPGDYIRICNRCQHQVIKNKSQNNTITFRRVIKIVRISRD